MVDSLVLLKNDCITYARLLGDYQAMSENELADGYCKACDEHNESKRNSYMSALILRFWYLLGKLNDECRTLNLEKSDFVSWITGSIELACAPDARKWQTNNKLNARQVIMQILATRFKAAAFYESNLAMHKANYNQLSLDEPLDDEENTVMDLIADPDSDVAKDSNAWSLIQELINKNKVVEAIIMDSIAFKDVFKHENHKETIIDDETGEKSQITKSTIEFWPYQLVKELNGLTDEYKKYFLERYIISEEKFDAAFVSITKAQNNRKYKMISKTLNGIRNDSSMLAMMQ